MARIRSIHPGLFTDEAFVGLSMPARMLLIGIWTDADDHGVFEWKPLSIKMRIFPADNIDVPALMEELAAANVVKRFELYGRSYGAVRNFCKYQRPKKPSYKHELPHELRTYVALKDAGSPPVPHQFPTSGEKPPQMEEEGGRREDVEDKKEGAGAPRAKSIKKDKKRAAPLPADFQPDWSAATAVGLSRNEAEREFLKFKNHSEANGRTCVNWQAAWRNWCITAAGYLKKPMKSTGPPTAVTITPKSRSWNAWKAHFRDAGMNSRASMMDQRATDGIPFTVPSEWPEGYEGQDAA